MSVEVVFPLMIFLQDCNDDWNFQSYKKISKHEVRDAFFLDELYYHIKSDFMTFEIN